MVRFPDVCSHEQRTCYSHLSLLSVFVAHDVDSKSIIVAHEGTNPKNMYAYSDYPSRRAMNIDYSRLSILNDIKFDLTKLDKQRFKSAKGRA